ncbi:O-antigen ligase family protein [Uliginosibacterium sp. TH139]|uniref:O-antigen ligase family protein n=1 Tax=Uliginosibacterium sp. TH139 TaxID=2067453 RepID=UPI000C7BB114|nr:O-antigen ligase family protein [Uliginosibacterium sp. TH139]PLK50057.1 hypothetical protein C0V76_06530 [Uliginosibacterium sp. TH139]
MPAQPSFYQKSFVCLVFLFLLLNYGLQVVQVALVPFGEVLLAVGAVVFFGRLGLIVEFVFEREFLFLLFFWVVGYCHLVFDVPEYGFWAIRDSSHLIETSAILLGYCIPVTCFAWFARKAKWFGMAVLLYAVLYVFRDYVLPFLPSMTTSAGAETTIFSYVSTASLLMVVAFYLIVGKNENEGVWPVVIFGLVFAYTVVVFQSRTTYIQFALLSIYVAWRKKGAAVLIASAVAAGLAGISVLSLFDLESLSRLGVRFDLSVLMNHIYAITGAPSEGFDDAAAGVGHRTDWWINIWNVAVNDWRVFLFGQGYGEPLIDFVLAGDVVVREPHNSYVSAFGRLGVVGFFLIVLLHSFLYFRGAVVVGRLKRCSGQFESYLLKYCDITIMTLICITAFSLGEDGMEKPFFAIPFYVFFGTFFRVNVFLARGRV